jgi:hypothetical protein
VAAATGSPVAVVLAIVFGINVVHDSMCGSQAARFAELFDTLVRYSGASLGYQIGAVLSGGFAPLIAAALLTAGHGNSWLSGKDRRAGSRPFGCRRRIPTRPREIRGDGRWGCTAISTKPPKNYSCPARSRCHPRAGSADGDMRSGITAEVAGCRFGQ